MDESSRIAQENLQLKNENERLRQIIFLLKRDKFGSKSEKLPDLDQSQFVFNELEVEAKNAEPPLPEQTELIEGYERKKRGRGKRKPFCGWCPSGLP